MVTWGAGDARMVDVDDEGDCDGAMTLVRVDGPLTIVIMPMLIPFFFALNLVYILRICLVCFLVILFYAQ